MKTIYDTIIVGCGSIGTTKNVKYDSPEDNKNILTLAHAVYNHPQTNLKYVIDYNFNKAKQAAEKWDTSPLISLDHLSEKDNIDIAIVAVPTVFHAPVLIDVLKLQPKLVIAEKPFCQSLKEAKAIRDNYQKNNIPILVDYIRNYEPVHQKMTENLSSGNLGKIYHCKLTYTRGTERESSHFIDLCNKWFGKYIRGNIMGGFLTDYSKQDPTYFVHLEYEKCPHVTLHPVDGRQYSIFEIDIYTGQGRFVFSSHGRYLDYYSIVPEPIYGDYNCLLNNLLKVQMDRVETQLTIALNNVIQNAVDVIENKSIPYCNDSDAVYVWEVLESLGLGYKLCK